MKKFAILSISIGCLVSVLIAGAAMSRQPSADPEQTQAASRRPGEKPLPEEKTLKLKYLEIVTRSVEPTCQGLAKAHGVTFSEPVTELGNARTATLKNVGRIGVRAPLNDGEVPVVRPYFLVDDIEAAFKAAKAGGAEPVVPPTAIAGGGKFAIYYLGKIEYGLWQH